MINCQVPHDHVIAVCNRLCKLPKVNEEASREGCKQRGKREAEVSLQAAGTELRSWGFQLHSYSPMKDSPSMHAGERKSFGRLQKWRWNCDEFSSIPAPPGMISLPCMDGRIGKSFGRLWKWSWHAEDFGSITRVHGRALKTFGVCKNIWVWKGCLLGGFQFSFAPST